MAAMVVAVHDRLSVDGSEQSLEDQRLPSAQSEKGSDRRTFSVLRDNRIPSSSPDQRYPQGWLGFLPRNLGLSPAPAGLSPGHSTERPQAPSEAPSRGPGTTQASRSNAVTAAPKPVLTQTAAIEKLQRFVRLKLFCPLRLDRRNLAERLQYEHNIAVGVWRLFRRVMIFALLMLSLRLSSDEDSKRGILDNLGQDFMFEELEQMVTREQVLHDALPHIAKQSRGYFPLSSRYFTTDQASSVELLHSPVDFHGPKQTPAVALTFQSFSILSWVRTDSEFRNGYLVNKRLPGERSPVLSCWAWYLDRELGPQLHYGAHDFFPANPLQTSEDRQVVVGLDTPQPFASDTQTLLSVVVNQTAGASEVTFYRNLDLLGTQPLPKLLSDCASPEQGLLVGDAGMALGFLRIFPEAFSINTIAEVFSAGTTLSEISTGSEPIQVTLSDIEANAPTPDDVPVAVASILDRVHSSSASAPPPSLSPPAPLGTITVNASLREDQVTGRGYVSLIEGPYLLSQTTTDAEHRSLVGTPSFQDTGATITFWYRNPQPRGKTHGGVFLLVAREPLQNRICWSLWLADNALWFDNVNGSPRYQYPTDFVDEQFWLDPMYWRHLAMVFDETSDNIRFYLDGSLAWEGPWGSSVRGADCPQNEIALGRAAPGWTYGAEVEVFDMRLYIHETAQGPLPDSELLALSTSNLPPVPAQLLCQTVDALQSLADSAWMDDMGNECVWYYSHRHRFPNVCQYDLAARNCPVACGTYKECFKSHPEDLNVHLVWDRIRRIVPKSSNNGTLCFGGGDGGAAAASEAVQRCRERQLNASLDEEMWEWRESFLSREGVRVDLDDCDEIAASFSAGCAFDLDPVRKFTQEVKQSNGDFSIGFWVRPLGQQSILRNGAFVPHLQFFSSLSPPKHNLALGLWANPEGEWRIFSSCGTGERDLFENVEVSYASTTEWTFIALTRKNATATTPGWQRTETNVETRWEGSSMPQCLYDDDLLFSALEINYAGLFSPIMMVAAAVPAFHLQQLYYRHVGSIQHQSGPAKWVEDVTHVPVSKVAYTARSVLIAPPVIFQTRHQASATCPVDFSSEYIAFEHNKMLGLRCSVPFKCEPEVVADPANTLSCPGPSSTEANVFGLRPIVFDGQVGYADLLYSVTDYPFLARDGAVRPTHDFLDSAVEMLETIMVFYTPKFAITSVLSVRAHFDAAAAASVKVSLRHHEIIEGTAFKFFVAVQVLLLGLVLLWMIDMVREVLGLRQLFQPAGDASLLGTKRQRVIINDFAEELGAFWWPIAKVVSDVIMFVLMAIFVSIRFQSKFSSGNDAQRIVSGLLELPWTERGLSVSAKKELFLEVIAEFLALSSMESNLAHFGNAILVLALIRVVQSTSVHPRLALLTETLWIAIDDLWHSLVLILLVMGLFAGIATWRFGGESEDFGSFSSTMSTQFEMFFGTFPEAWKRSPEMQIYTLLYMLVVFVFIQNFLLAIVVEAYLNVRKHIEDVETEEEFFADVKNSYWTYLVCRYYGWPSPGHLSAKLKECEAKRSVSFVELQNTKLFRSQRSICQFLDYYSGYHFLRHVPVNGFTPVDHELSEHEKIAESVARRLGHVQTLAELGKDVAAMYPAPAPRNNTPFRESSNDSTRTHQRQPIPTLSEQLGAMLSRAETNGESAGPSQSAGRPQIAGGTAARQEELESLPATRHEQQDRLPSIQEVVRSVSGPLSASSAIEQRLTASLSTNAQQIVSLLLQSAPDLGQLSQPHSGSPGPAAVEVTAGVLPALIPGRVGSGDAEHGGGDTRAAGEFGGQQDVEGGAASEVDGEEEDVDEGGAEHRTSLSRRKSGESDDAHRWC